MYPGLAAYPFVDALEFAAEKHKHQRRKNSEQSPYINHPIGLVHILVHEGFEDCISVLVGALLHDTVEDTDATLEEISERFGSAIADVVAEVTDDKSLPKVTRKQLQITNAPHKSHNAKLIKLADKLHNLRDLQVCPPMSWSKEYQRGYFVWSYEVIQGLRGTNSLLEEQLDIVFDKANINVLADIERQQILEQFYSLCT